MELLYNDNHCKLYVSQIIDNLHDLAQFLGADTETVVNEAQRRFKSQHRQNEWLTVRAMLCQIFGHAKKVDYTVQGKPYVSDIEYKISISHSKKYAALLLSDMDHVGVDVEMISDKVLRVANRISTSCELPENFEDFGAIQKQRWITTLWTIKEAVYKSLENQELDLLVDIVAKIGDTQVLPTTISVSVKDSNDVCVRCLEYHDNICTFVNY